VATITPGRVMQSILTLRKYCKKLAIKTTSY